MPELVACSAPPTVVAPNVMPAPLTVRLLLVLPSTVSVPVDDVTVALVAVTCAMSAPALTSMTVGPLSVTADWNALVVSASSTVPPVVLMSLVPTTLTAPVCATPPVPPVAVSVPPTVVAPNETPLPCATRLPEVAPSTASVVPAVRPALATVPRCTPRASTSCSVTAPPLVTLTRPPKLSAGMVSVMALVPASSVLVPVTVRPAACVIEPAWAVAVRLPMTPVVLVGLEPKTMLPAPSARAPPLTVPSTTSASAEPAVTLAPPVLVTWAVRALMSLTDTVPPVTDSVLKSLAPPSETVFEPAVMVAAPEVAVMEPPTPSVMVDDELAPKVPVAVRAFSMSIAPPPSAMLWAVMLPVVVRPAPAVSATSPVVLMLPTPLMVSVLVTPFATSARLPPTPSVGVTFRLVLASMSSDEPEAVMAPVKTLLFPSFSVTTSPAVRPLVPVTARTPVWVIAPEPALESRLPCTVVPVVPKPRPTLVVVRSVAVLPSMVSSPPAVTVAAPVDAVTCAISASVSRSETDVPEAVTALAKLLVGSLTSTAPVAVMLEVPVAVTVPMVCVTLPPVALSVRVPPALTFCPRPTEVPVSDTSWPLRLPPVLSAAPALSVMLPAVVTAAGAGQRAGGDEAQVAGGAGEGGVRGRARRWPIR